MLHQLRQKPELLRRYGPTDAAMGVVTGVAIPTN
jgi:hypothetical protein